MHGMTCAQVFVPIEGFINEYPLRNNGYAYDSLTDFYVTVGFPPTL